MSRLVCFLLGHQYHVKQVFSAHSRRVECLRCEREWGMSDDVRAFIPWDDELAQMYRMFGHRILK